MQPGRIRLSANLGFLWAELPLLSRIEHAAANGFEAIELHWPYDTDPTAVGSAVKDLGLVLLSINTPQGDVAAGDAGLAAQVDRVSEFKDTFLASLEWACASGAGLIHVLPGMADLHRLERSREVFIENLRWAADQARDRNITLLLEALNPRDKPGYFYHTQAQADSIREATGKDNVKLMFDVYHVGVAEGDILMKLQRYLPAIGHIQIAAVPTRAEPDEGEVSYQAVFDRMKSLGYRGWVGCEYKPRANLEQGLAWRQTFSL